MARCEIKMPDEFLMKCSRLRDKTDEIIPEVLKDGGEVVLSKVRSNLASVIGRGTKYPSRTTGKLAGALGLSSARVNRSGNHDVKVGFSDPRRGGSSNAKIANILEHGRHGQPPKPFLRPARAASRKLCIETMKSRLEREIENL